MFNGKLYSNVALTLCLCLELTINLTLTVILTRDVKRSSNFRSLNCMFEFEFVSQTLDIRFQLALIRHRPFLPR